MSLLFSLANKSAKALLHPPAASPPNIVNKPKDQRRSLADALHDSAHSRPEYSTDAAGLNGEDPGITPQETLFSPSLDMDSVSSPLKKLPQPRAGAASRLSSLIRFPLVLLLNFGLSSLLYTLAADLTGNKLAAVSRNLTQAWQISFLVAWKFTEVSIAWYAGYDYLDITYLTLLNNVPHYFLLNTFYGIDVTASLLPLLIDVSVVALPFFLFRGLDHGHVRAAKKTANQAVAQDFQIDSLTSLLGSTLYALTVYGSFLTWLPTHMILHFDGLRSLEKAYSTAIYLLVALFIPLGYATTQFLFVPAIGSPGQARLAEASAKHHKHPFHPKTATLGETIMWNVGLGEYILTHRAELLAKRTAVLAVSTFVNTFIRGYFTIEGTEFVGVLGWAGVWATAASLVGIAFSWLGSE